MISEILVSNQFRATITVNFCRSFRDNQFCEILFDLKTAGYLCLARDIITFASNYYEDIFCFDDLVSAPITAQFLRCVEKHLHLHLHILGR